MTKQATFLDFLPIVYIALIFVAFHMVSVQNGANAYWSVDASSGRDFEERSCFGTAQANYNVSFGLANDALGTAETAALTIYTNTTNEIDEREDQTFVRVDRIEAQERYRGDLSSATSWYTNEVEIAQSRANSAVSACKRAANERLNPPESTTDDNTASSGGGGLVLGSNTNENEINELIHEVNYDLPKTKVTIIEVSSGGGSGGSGNQCDSRENKDGSIEIDCED